MTARPVGVDVPLDTDRISPDALKAAVIFGIERAEHAAEKDGEALNWNGTILRLHPDPDDASTTRLQIRIPRLSR